MFESGPSFGESTADTVIVTCTLDSRAHAVPDSELTSAALDAGRLNALCGHVIAAAPLTEPDGEPCAQCLQLQFPPTRRRLGDRLRRLI